MPHSQSCIFQSDPCSMTKISKLPDFFVVSNNSFLTIKKKSHIEKMGQGIYQLQQLPRNLTMTAENSNSSPMQLEVFSPKTRNSLITQQWEMKTHVALSAQDFEDRFQVRYLLWQ